MVWDVTLIATLSKGTSYLKAFRHHFFRMTFTKIPSGPTSIASLVDSELVIEGLPDVVENCQVAELVPHA
jgi:hypothetical protein